MKQLVCGFALCVLLAISHLGFSQATSVNGGSVQGTVTDPSGASIPGAMIVIADPNTGYTHALTTDSVGFYSLGPLNPGSYTIDISAANFERLKTAIVVKTGTATNGSEKLTLGKASQTIEVSTDALTVNGPEWCLWRGHP